MHHEMLPLTTYLFSLVLASKVDPILHLSIQINPTSGTVSGSLSLLMLFAYQSDVVLSRYQELALKTQTLELKEDKSQLEY